MGEVITMKNKKKLILNISFFVTIALTIIFYLNEYFYFKNELATLQKTNGDGYYIAELYMLTSQILLVIWVAIETSVYYNLRYFIIDENKRLIKTVFNVILLVSAVCLLPCFYILNKTEIPLFEMFVLMLLLLRVIYIFISRRL